MRFWNIRISLINWIINEICNLFIIAVIWVKTKGNVSDTGTLYVHVSNNKGCEATETIIISSRSCLTSTDHETDNNVSISIYPNPTSGKLLINLGEKQNSVKITLRNISGQLIFEDHLINTEIIETEFDGPAGVYILEIISDLGLHNVFKVLKE